MKSIRSLWERIKNSRWFVKLRSVKNIEIVIAAILALIAIVAYFAIASGDRKTKAKASFSVESKMTDEETRLSSILSQMEGIGESKVYISYDNDKKIAGVVVVAKGADSAEKRVSVIRCVEIATGASVDQIQIFQMANGG